MDLEELYKQLCEIYEDLIIARENLDSSLIMINTEELSNICSRLNDILISFNSKM